MSNPVAALPADLQLLLNDLEHVLSINGLKGQQHSRYINDELHAKASSRDVEDRGKLDQNTRSRKRVKELLLKHDAYEMCFDAFCQSSTMHQPSYQTSFQQKLWRHAMLLVEEWQDLHEQQQMQLKSLAVDHLHLQQEHKTLKANLKNLKLTVQTMLGDVSALLHHATRNKDQPVVEPGQQQPDAPERTSSRTSSRSSSRNSNASGRCQPESSASLPSVPARRSSDIVNSLIKSIDKMTKQFASCQDSRLSGPCDNSSSATSQQQQEQRQSADGSEQRSTAVAKLGSCSAVPQPCTEHAAANAADDLSVQPTSNSSICHSNIGSAPAASTAADAQQRTKINACMPPLAPAATDPKSKHITWQLPEVHTPGSERRNIITARSVGGAVVQRDKASVLAGASPHRSHPPSAYDTSVAWFMQNADPAAQGKGSSSSNRQQQQQQQQNGLRTRPASAGASEVVLQAVDSSANRLTAGLSSDLSCEDSFSPSQQPLLCSAQASSLEVQAEAASVLPSGHAQAEVAPTTAAAATGPDTAACGPLAAAGRDAEAAGSCAESENVSIPQAASPKRVVASDKAAAAADEDDSDGNIVAGPAAAGMLPAGIQAEWMSALRQQPGALQKVRAAVRLALADGEPLREPSMSDWADAGTRCSTGRDAADVEPAGPAVAVNAAAAATQDGPGSSNSDSSAATQQQTGEEDGLPAPAAAGSAASAAQVRVLSTAAMHGGRSGYTLAAQHKQQQQQLSGLSRLPTQQQQQPTYQPRAGSAEPSAQPRLRRVGSATPTLHSPNSTCLNVSAAKRPSSSHEVRSPVNHSSSSSSLSNNNSAVAAAALSRSRSVGAALGRSALAPAGFVSRIPSAITAGPLTAALQKQTQLAARHSHLKHRAAAAGSIICSSASPAVLSSTGLAAAAAVSNIASVSAPSMAAVSRQRPASGGHGRSAARNGSKQPAAAAAAATAGGNYKGRCKITGAAGTTPGLHSSPQQQQQQQAMHSQRRLHKHEQQMPQQQQQQQNMAAVPEGQLADSPSEAAAAAHRMRTKTYSMASDSIGSDMVRLGSCNVGFWAAGGAVYNGAGSPAEHSTASKASSPLSTAAAAVQVAAVEEAARGVSAMLGAAIVPAVASHEQHTQQQGLSLPGVAAPVDTEAAAQQLAYAAVNNSIHIGSSRNGNGTGSNIPGAVSPREPVPGQPAEASCEQTCDTCLLTAAGAATATYAPAAEAAAGDSAAWCDSIGAAAAALEAGVPGASDVQDAVKPTQRTDSPQKQARKAAAAAAAASAMLTSSNIADVVMLHASPMKSGFLAPNSDGDKQVLQGSLTNSIAQVQHAWLVQTDRNNVPAAAVDCPASPVGPLSKRLRSSIVLVEGALCNQQQQHDVSRKSIDKGSCSGFSAVQQNLSAAAGEALDAAAHTAVANAPKSTSSCLVIQHDASVGCVTTSTAAGEALDAAAHTAVANAPKSTSSCLVIQHDASVGCVTTSTAAGVLQKPCQRSSSSMDLPDSQAQRVSEDGGRDVGPVYDRSKDSFNAKWDTSVAASGITSGAVSGPAPDGPQKVSSTCASKHNAVVTTTDVATTAELRASTADSLIASSAGSSELLSTARGNFAALATGQAEIDPTADVDTAGGQHNAAMSIAADDTCSLCPGAADASCTSDEQQFATPAKAKAAADAGDSAAGAGRGVGNIRFAGDDATAADAASDTDSSSSSLSTDGSVDLSFTLDELVAILIDVMHSKQEQGERLAAAGLQCHTPTAYLHHYLAAKVHGDRDAYENALKALLSGLEVHKQHQPEVAVFCRILTGDVDEEYFQQHLVVRSHLQQIATKATQHAQEHTDTQQQLQHCIISDKSSDVAMNTQQLLLLILDAWSRQRLQALAKSSAAGQAAPQELQQQQQEWRRYIQSRCGRDICASGVVSALLFWELEQHVERLQATVEAFKVADQQQSGKIDLQQFRVFCKELNDTMSEEEVQTLWSELDRQQHGSVTFGTVCSCLLPAMNEM